MRILSIFLLLFMLTACYQPPRNLFENGGTIGGLLMPGAMMFDPNTGTYYLSGGGANMWGESDEFFMIWTEKKGDFTFSAKVAFKEEGIDPHRKMGLIIRKTLAPNAVYADVAVHGDGLTSLQYREAEGEETLEVKSTKTAPDYITLERKGNKLLMRTGDTPNPTEVDGEITLDLPESCYVGLFICAHHPTATESGVFSEVTLK